MQADLNKTKQQGHL